MEFGSLSRRHGKSASKQNCRARRSFSTSNLSFTSSSSTSIGRQSLYLTLPKNLGCELGHDGRVLHLTKGGPAHSSGVIQIGDVLDLTDDSDCHNDQEMVTVRVTYGVLQIDSRPSCPLVIKIGNRSHTSLGIALGDVPGKQIKISSIQTGSLADRCGFLLSGDLLTAIQISEQHIPCSPCYTSYQVAQILRKLTSTKSSITLTIVPLEEIESSDNNSGSSTVTLRDSLNHHMSNNPPFATLYCNKGNHKKKTMKTFQDNEKIEYGAENECVLSLCLWKDRLYEDWGFSLIDDDDSGRREGSRGRVKFGAFVHDIRPGGPAFLAGLQPGDRFLQINDQDVANLESTILVPMLASLDDALNVVVARVNT